MPATAESARRRKYVVAWQPLFEILSEKLERWLRFSLSYGSGIRGSIMGYESTGALSVYDAFELVDMSIERAQEDLEIIRESVRLGIVEAFNGKTQ